MDDLFAIYVLYVISVTSGRLMLGGGGGGGGNGRQFAIKSRLQLKRFPSSAPSGKRARDCLIIKLALNPLIYRAYRETKR